MDWEQLKLQIKTNPRSSLRFVAGLAVTLVMLWILVLVQANTGEEDRFVDPDTLKMAAAAASEKQNAASASVGRNSESGSSGMPLVTFFVLAGGLIGYGWYRKGKGNSPRPDQKSGTHLSLVERVEIAPGHVMAIVQVGDEYWVTGSGSQGFTLLKSIRKEEWSHAGDDRPEADKGGGFAALIKSIRTGSIPMAN